MDCNISLFTSLVNVEMLACHCKHTDVSMWQKLRQGRFIYIVLISALHKNINTDIETYKIETMQCNIIGHLNEIKNSH